MKNKTNCFNTYFRTNYFASRCESLVFIYSDLRTFLINVNIYIYIKQRVYKYAYVNYGDKTMRENRDRKSLSTQM